MESAGEDMEELKISYTASGNVKWYNHFEKSLAVFFKVKHIFIVQLCVYV